MPKLGSKRKPKAPASGQKPKGAKIAPAATTSTPRTQPGSKRKEAAMVEDDPIVAEDEEMEEAVEELTKREFSSSWGSRFMLFRILICLVETAGTTPRWVWQRCSGTTRLHSTDSYVYRYEREAWASCAPTPRKRRQTRASGRHASACGKTMQVPHPQPRCCCALALIQPIVHLCTYKQPENE